MKRQPPKRKSLWRRLRGVRNLLLAAVAAVVIVLFRIASRGLPESWTDRLSDALSTTTHLVELDDLTFTFRHGLNAGRARITPNVLGEAEILSLRNVRLKFRWRPGEALPMWLRALEIEEFALMSIPAVSDREARPAPPFGPVRVRCATASILGTKVYNIHGVVSLEDTTLKIEHLRGNLAPARQASENLAGDFIVDIHTGDISGGLKGEFNPLRLTPLMRALGIANTASFLERFAFPAELPVIKCHLDYAPAENRRRAEIAIAVTGGSYRGVPVLSARADAVLEGGREWERMRLGNLVVTRPEGRAQGELTYDLIKDGIYFDATSTIDPKRILAFIGAFEEHELDIFRFGAPANAVAKGYYGFDDSKESTAIEGTLQLPTLTVGPLTFTDASGEFVIHDRKYAIPKFQATFYGGACSASGVVHRAASGERPFELRAEVADAPTGKILSGLFDRKSDDTGKASLTLTMGGDFLTNTVASLHGSGDARVRKSQLYRMPIFAGFTDFMARNISGVNFLVSQNDLDTKFSIGDSRIHFSRLRIEGAIFSIAGDGDYWLDDELDIGIKVHLLKHDAWVGSVLKVVLYPVSKLFELEVTGPLSDPKWSPTTLALRRRRSSSGDRKKD